MIISVFDELKTLVEMLDPAVLAKDAGVDVDTIYRLRNGGTPRIKSAVKIAKALGRYMILPPNLQKMVTFYGKNQA